MDLKKIKVSAVKGENTKLVLDWMQLKGYHVKSHRRFQTVRFSDEPFISFYGHEDGSVGFSEVESYFEELNWFDATELVTPASAPPIGVVPEKLWKLQRKNDLIDALLRSLRDGKEYPVEWLHEIEKLNKETVC